MGEQIVLFASSEKKSFLFYNFSCAASYAMNFILAIFLREYYKKFTLFRGMLKASVVDYNRCPAMVDGPLCKGEDKNMKWSGN